MQGIFLTDDELKILEKRFGPGVRKMGPWNTDGTFGYSCVSMAVVKKAAESIGDQDLIGTLTRLNNVSDRSKAFMALLQTFGQALIERIVAVYRQSSFELTFATPLSRKPPDEEPRRMAAAAG